MSRWKIIGFILALGVIVLIAAMFYSCQSGSYPREQEEGPGMQQQSAPLSSGARKQYV